MTQPNSTAQPFESPVAGERGGAATSPRSFIRTGAWLRWCYENLSEHHYLLMLKAHRGGA